MVDHITVEVAFGGAWPAIVVTECRPAIESSPVTSSVKSNLVHGESKTIPRLDFVFSLCSIDAIVRQAFVGKKAAMNQELQGELSNSFAELRRSIAEVRHAIEMESLRLQLRFGVMLVVAVVFLAVILKHK